MSSFKTAPSDFQSKPLGFTRDERAEKAAKQAVSDRLKFTTHKGFVNPDQWKEFNRVWSQFKASEITREELEAWIERFNFRVGS